MEENELTLFSSFVRGSEAQMGALWSPRLLRLRGHHPPHPTPRGPQPPNSLAAGAEGHGHVCADVLEQGTGPRQPLRPWVQPLLLDSL